MRVDHKACDENISEFLLQPVLPDWVGFHPISHDVTKHTHTAKTTGADADVAATILANPDQQADVIIHE